MQPAAPVDPMISACIQTPDDMKLIDVLRKLPHKDPINRQFGGTHHRVLVCCRRALSPAEEELSLVNQIEKFTHDEGLKIGEAHWAKWIKALHFYPAKEGALFDSKATFSEEEPQWFGCKASNGKNYLAARVVVEVVFDLFSWHAAIQFQKRFITPVECPVNRSGRNTKEITTIALIYLEAIRREHAMHIIGHNDTAIEQLRGVRGQFNFTYAFDVNMTGGKGFYGRRIEWKNTFCSTRKPAEEVVPGLKLDKPYSVIGYKRGLESIDLTSVWQRRMVCSLLEERDAALLKIQQLACDLAQKTDAAKQEELASILGSKLHCTQAISLMLANLWEDVDDLEHNLAASPLEITFVVAGMPLIKQISKLKENLRDLQKTEEKLKSAKKPDKIEKYQRDFNICRRQTYAGLRNIFELYDEVLSIRRRIEQRMITVDFLLKFDQRTTMLKKHDRTDLEQWNQTLKRNLEKANISGRLTHFEEAFNTKDKELNMRKLWQELTQKHAEFQFKEAAIKEDPVREALEKAQFKLGDPTQSRFMLRHYQIKVGLG